MNQQPMTSLPLDLKAFVVSELVSQFIPLAFERIALQLHQERIAALSGLQAAQGLSKLVRLGFRDSILIMLQSL